MCGRTACALSKEKIVQACSYKHSANRKVVVPAWVDLNKTVNYQPSYNIGPGSQTPILLSGGHCKGLLEQVSPVLALMRWGLVPSWHRGDPKEFGLKTTNCRLEGIKEKPTYKGPLQQGKRCVVIAEGFFEWKQEQSKKQPYFIYFPQAKETNMATRSWEGEDSNQISGPRLLTMAGLFDRLILQNGEEYFSYTIITKESSPALSWLHSRMPAILDGEESILEWIDEAVPLDEALNLLNRPANLEWHSVSPVVGNVRNNSVECVRPWKVESKKSSTQSITNWFKPKTEDGCKPAKISKTE